MSFKLFGSNPFSWGGQQDQDRRARFDDAVLASQGIMNKTSMALNDPATYSNDVFGGGGHLGSTQFGNISRGFGAAATEAGGKAGNVAGGLLGMAGAFGDLMSYDPEVGEIDREYSIDERPTYDLGEFEAATRELGGKEFKKAANQKVASSSLSGLQAGSVFGPLGSGIGLAIGAGIGLIGKGKAKRKAKEAKAKAMKKLQRKERELQDVTRAYDYRESSAASTRARRSQRMRDRYFGLSQQNDPFAGN
jgi:hypothetical protein